MPHDALVDGNLDLVLLLDQLLHAFWMSATGRRRALVSSQWWHPGIRGQISWHSTHQQVFVSFLISHTTWQVFSTQAHVRPHRSQQVVPACTVRRGCGPASRTPELQAAEIIANVRMTLSPMLKYAVVVAAHKLSVDFLATKDGSRGVVRNPLRTASRRYPCFLRSRGVLAAVLYVSMECT